MRRLDTTTLAAGIVLLSHDRPSIDSHDRRCPPDCRARTCPAD